MSSIRVDYTGGSRRIDVGERVTFGRQADVELAGRLTIDKALHGEAFGITARVEGFDVDVDGDHGEVWVTQLPRPGAGPPEQRIVQGEIYTCPWAWAEITAEGWETHRVVVIATPGPSPPVGKRMDTELIYPLDLERQPEHRLLVALCEKRLFILGAGALGYGEALALLVRAGRPEDRSIAEGTARGWISERVRPVLQGHMEWEGAWDSDKPVDLDTLVDWCVRKKVVQKVHYLTLLARATS